MVYIRVVRLPHSRFFIYRLRRAWLLFYVSGFYRGRAGSATPLILPPWSEWLTVASALRIRALYSTRADALVPFRFILFRSAALHG